MSGSDLYAPTLKGTCMAHIEISCMPDTCWTRCWRWQHISYGNILVMAHLLDEVLALLLELCCLVFHSFLHFRLCAYI